MLTHLAETMTTSFEFTPSHTSSAPSSSTQKSNIQVQCKVRTRIPTSQFGDIYVHLYENNQDDKQHLAIVFGMDIRSKSLETVQPATQKSIPNVKSDLANSISQSENGNANGTAESVSENVESDLDRFVRGAIPLNSLDSIKHTCAACHDSQIENGHTHNSLPSSPATPQPSSHSSSSNSYFPTITPSTILLNGNTVIQPIRKIHPRHASIPPQQQSMLNTPPSSVPPPQLTKPTPLSNETAVQPQSSASSAPAINTENESRPSKPPLVRIHSECFTGETLFSIRCDCGEQLQQAMKRIMKEGSGVIVYLRQEGRGIGLLDKLRAYNLQDLGHDTVTANLLLHHPADLRSYDIASNILMDLNIENIRLLTNNPDKIEQLEREGVKVTKRVSMVPKSWKKMMMGKNPRVISGRSRTRKLSQPSNRSRSNLNESTLTKNTLSSSTLPHNNSLSRPYSPVVASTSSPLASSSSLASVSLPAAGDLRNKKQSRSELGMQSTGFDSQNELYIASMGLKHPKEHKSSDNSTKLKSNADKQNGTVTDANDVARKEQDCEDDWSDLPQDGTQKIEKPTRTSNLSKPSTHSHSSTSRPTSTSKNSQHRQRRRSQSSHHDSPTSSSANSDEEEEEDTHIESNNNRSDSKNLEDDLVNRDDCETEDDDDEDQDEDSKYEELNGYLKTKIERMRHLLEVPDRLKKE